MVQQPPKCTSAPSRAIPKRRTTHRGHEGEAQCDGGDHQVDAHYLIAPGVVRGPRTPQVSKASFPHC